MTEKILKILNNLQIKKNRRQISTLDHPLRLRNDLGFDSLDLAELTVHIENEFGVDIFEDGIIETVGEIFEKLEQK